MHRDVNLSPRPTSLKLLSSIAVLSLLVGACGSSGDRDEVGATTSAAGQTTRDQLAATDVGVTAEAITLGVMLLSCEGCASFGYEYPSTGPEIVQAFVADLNARGGINGRDVEAVVEEFDQLEDALEGGASQRRACIEITAQQSIFAALAIGVTQLECLYRENETPVIASSIGNVTDPGSFDESGGRLWTVHPSPSRILVNWADQLVSSGTLAKDEPFGIVTMDSQEFDRPIRDVLIPHLEDLGLAPAHVAVLPADPAASATARATEGSSMRGKGIETVLLAVDFLTSSLWIQESERNGWEPQYLVSDYATPASEQTAALQPPSFVGALAVSSTPVEGAEPTKADRDCAAVWEVAAGRSAEGGEEATLVGSICSLFRAFERGAVAAGDDLTRDGFVSALAGLGEFPIAGVAGGVGTFGGTYRFGDVKWSAVDRFVLKRWDGDRYVEVEESQMSA